MKIKGLPASRGVAKGYAIVAKDLEDLLQKVSNDSHKEYILVTEMTSPTWTTIPSQVKAIVTDEGGILCHAAIIARELGIPCVVGTKIATKVIKDGLLIYVNGDAGEVEICER